MNLKGGARSSTNGQVELLGTPLKAVRCSTGSKGHPCSFGAIATDEMGMPYSISNGFRVKGILDHQQLEWDPRYQDWK